MTYRWMTVAVGLIVALVLLIFGVLGNRMYYEVQTKHDCETDDGKYGSGRVRSYCWDRTTGELMWWRWVP